MCPVLPGIHAQVATVAGRQHGVIARGQLEKCGLSKWRIERLVRDGQLIRLHRGVFAVGHRAIGEKGRAMAAVLACGPGAVLAGMWAAALWGLCRWPRGDVEVIAGSGRTRKGIRVRRAGLERGEVTRHFGIPVTTAARTLKDLGEPPKLVAEAQVRRLIPSPAEGITRSELERRFLRVVEEAGLPRPLTNHRVEGFEVDAVWLEQRLVVELDGWEYHRTHEAFERDRERDGVLMVAGWRTLRITARGIDAELLRQALARGPA